MKKVCLLGDSIRMGYDSYVKEKLEGIAEVYYDDEDNGRFSAYTIWQFNQLIIKYGKFDVVHFNNGYWDMNQEGPNGEVVFSTEEYVHNLKRIIDTIREIGAKPVFATTIPICDNAQGKDGFAKIAYKNSWVKEYNDAALKLMEVEGVEVNDLYSLLLDKPNCMKCPDSLHLTEEGYQMCANQVVEHIKNNL